MTEFIISSEQLERIIEAVEHNTQREINRVVIDGCRVSEIVRCMDCEFFEQDDVADGCTQFDFSIEYMERGYCAWGERRSE